jgi:hypothetical protein
VLCQLSYAPSGSSWDSTGVAVTDSRPHARRAARRWERFATAAARVDVPLLVIVVLAAGFVASYTRRVTDWIVMTDELLYSKLAISVAESLSPLPTLRGEPVSLSSQLYPLLTAPLYAAFDVPTAFHAVHVLNAVLLASAAVPAYFLARAVFRWRPEALLAAAFAVAVPWLVLGFYGMTEVAAYPAFLWAVLAIQHAAAAAALRHDLLAIAAIGIAVLARTQFFLLLVVLPLAIVLHEAGYRLAIARRDRWPALREGLRTAFGSHRALAAFYGLLVLLAVPLAVTGRLDDLLGPYAITATEGSLLPEGVWSSAAEHLGSVAIASGILPFAVAAGWAVAAAARPDTKTTHAYALVLLLVGVALTLQVSSFAVRFGGGATRDRYLFYLAPLFFVGLLACLRDERRRWLAVLGGTALFVLVARQADLQPPPGFWEFHAIDRPASALNGLLTHRAADLGIGPATLVVAIGIALGLLVAAGLHVRDRAPLALALGVAVVAFCAIETRHTLERLEAGMSPSGRPLAGPSAETRDWIDEALPSGGRAGLIPYPVAATWGPSAVAWWDAEFWNGSAVRAYVLDEGLFSYTPATFPRRRLSLDFTSGRIDAPDQPAYLVLARSEVRVRPRGERVAVRDGLELLRAERPYSAAWATDGLTFDGWTLPDRHATIRLYAARGAETSRRRVRIELSGVGAREPRRFSARSGLAEASGGVTPDGRATAQLDVCVPAGGSADVLIDVSPAGLVPGLPTAHGAETNLRAAGLKLTQVDAAPARGGC